MSVSVIVPFRPSFARIRAWEFVRERYRTLYPDWQIVEGRSRRGRWCKGDAVNRAVERAKGDRLVIADADMLVEDDVMRVAVESLGEHQWVVPHRRAYRLTEEATERIYTTQVPTLDVGRLFDCLTHDDLEMQPRRMYPCGGVFYIRRSAYLEAGGIDERFVGWGGEDEAFGLCLTALFGPPLILDTILVHLYHEPQAEMPASRQRPPEVDHLVKQYEAATDPVAMLELLAAR